MSAQKLLGSKRVSITDPIGALTEKMTQITSSRQFSDENIGKSVIATESMDDTSAQMITGVYNNMESTIKTIAKDFNIAVEDFQLEAATIAGMFATNPALAMSTKLKPFQSDSIVMVPSVVDGMMDRPQVSTEAYDERENKNAQLYSIIYNLLASRQDEFGEMFFPTIVVNPNEVGITLSVKLFYVYNDFKRSANGTLANYGRKNVIRAYADAEILKNELTKVVPVLRTGGGADDNTDKFVPVTDVPGWSVNLGVNVTVPTGALKVDTKVDLIGISQTNELLNSGIMGPSDNLDTFIKLEAVFVKVTDGTNTNVIKVLTENLPAATFTYAPQGNSRKMILAMDTDGVVLDQNTVSVTGAPATALSELTNHKARVQIGVNGSVVLDKGEGSVSRGSLSLVALRNAAGQLVTGSTFNTLAEKLANAEIIGYTIQAYRANSNIRQRGQLLDSQVEFRSIPVPYRSPLGVLAPAINANTDDNSALQNLITTTGIRVSNEAVTALLKAQVALAAYNPVADANGELPEMAAIGQFYVKPVSFFEAINLAETVDSIKSQDRFKDIRGALIEKLRFYANEMYRQSEYKAAAAVLTGNAAFKPTVILGTDTVTANYLMLDGDLRDLGENFDVRIVSTLDERVKGKIFMSFGVFDASRNTSINPLNFGNMLFSPESTTVMPVSRDGQVSKELIVTPRFVHNVNLPVLTMLTVSNLPEVTGKVAVNMNAV